MKRINSDKKENRGLTRFSLCGALVAGSAVVASLAAQGAEVTLASAPPVVVQTVPAAGATEVDPGLSEIRVTFSKPMQDGSWSWVVWREGTFPEMAGQPRYLADGRTCILPVKLQPGRLYATAINAPKYQNFKDKDGLPAVPYLLTFRTSGSGGGSVTQPDSIPDRVEITPSAGNHPADIYLNEDQKMILRWTDSQFRSYFDKRTFDGWDSAELGTLERKLIDALNGPQNREFFQAIGSLAAMKSTNALPRLRQMAFERVDKNNRDRWMAVRALGLIGDQAAVPELVHLVYHGNVNTRWWAQISLVRLTGQNFGSDWNAWGKWWNDHGGVPRYDPELITWWTGQAPANELASSLAESDRTFLDNLKR